MDFVTRREVRRLGVLSRKGEGERCLFLKTDICSVRISGIRTMPSLWEGVEESFNSGCGEMDVSSLMEL